MTRSELKVAVEADQDALREQLRGLGGDDANATHRDAFLDAWVAYNSVVDLVLFDTARRRLEGGDTIVDDVRKDLPAFQQKFAELESAHDIAAVAKAVAPAFESQLDRVMKEVVVPLTEQLEVRDVAEIAKRYLRARSAN